MGGENKKVNPKNKLKSFLRRYYQQKVPLNRIFQNPKTKKTAKTGISQNLSQKLQKTGFPKTPNPNYPKT